LQANIISNSSKINSNFSSMTFYRMGKEITRR
jgi:hypothetical protein